MTDTVLVTAAWPYANAEIHVGNLTDLTCRPIYSLVTTVCAAGKIDGLWV